LLLELERFFLESALVAMDLFRAAHVRPSGLAPQV
jgi:hypothetical protein